MPRTKGTDKKKMRTFTNFIVLYEDMIERGKMKTRLLYCIICLWKLVFLWGTSWVVCRGNVENRSGKVCFCAAEASMQAMIKTLVWAFVVLFLFLVRGEEEKIVYKFQEFFYKGNSKNEVAFREFESACEQNPDCASKSGPERFACVRRCISPSCHQDLYGHDPWEEGEIDVRLNSFKGCFIQRLNRPRQ